MQRYKLLKQILITLSVFSSKFRLDKMESKVDNTPVTELDIVNQYIIEQSIKLYFTNDNIIAEENLSSDFSKITLKKYQKDIEYLISIIKQEKILKDNTTNTWFIDPIDGTKGFIDNLTFSIAISILSNNKLKFSGIASIGLNKSIKYLSNIVIATTNNNEIEIFNEKLESLNTQEINTSSYVIAISRKHKTKKLYRNLLNKKYKLIEMDSQAKYILVLLGIANFYIREQGSCGANNDYSWDHLAGIHLVRVNNGYIADLYNKTPKFCEKSDKIIFDNFLITTTSEYEYNTIIKDLEE
ncbi:hypothetical protein JHD48_09700 [Sulfurimonas sp. SAG-AH-194-I05]|nr:inositol monophosphatase family protein [Sulfurimonas sp. SAG-AH-194-I05]MDF1876009.1 hypothetical protein [Sulfurimonas sp. SAG-AH-194-I05]